MKNAIDSAIDQTKKTVANAHDHVDESLNRSAADSEKTRREVSGETMTPKQKLESGANEIQFRARAELDKAKRAVR